MVEIRPDASDSEIAAMRSSVRDLLTHRYGRSYVRTCDAQHKPPSEAFQALARLDCLGLNVPQEYGGSGLGAAAVAALLEEVGYAFLDLAFWLFRNLGHGSHTIGRFGTEAQKAQFLPRIADGSISVCFALTEPDSGSDAAAIQTKAVHTSDQDVVSGEKIFCSGFKVSDYVLTVTRTNRDGRKHDGMSLLLIPTSLPGVTASPVETMGHWPLGTVLLHFDEVKVPEANRIGPEGGGWSVLMEVLAFERLCLSAARTGAAQAALDDAVQYAKDREQFGRPIGSFQAISHKLADMAVMVDISRMLVTRFAERLQSGTASARDAATLKLFVSESYKSVADMGLQVLGGYGYTNEYDLQRHFRESRLGTIGAGTSEIQRNIIAKTLGL